MNLTPFNSIRNVWQTAEAESFAFLSQEHNGPDSREYQLTDHRVSNALETKTPYSQSIRDIEANHLLRLNAVTKIINSARDSLTILTTNLPETGASQLDYWADERLSRALISALRTREVQLDIALKNPQDFNTSHPLYSLTASNAVRVFDSILAPESEFYGCDTEFVVADQNAAFFQQEGAAFIEINNPDVQKFADSAQTMITPGLQMCKQRSLN